jgi:hypothetical protein
MSKLFVAIMITGALLATGYAYAQTTVPSSPNAQNPEATCPVGATCTPGRASPTTAGVAESSPSSRDVTGSTARPSSEKNPEHTCPPGSKC